MKEEVLKKLHESGLKYYDLPSFDEFKQDMQSEETALKFKQSMSEHYDMPDDSQFLIDIVIQDVKKKDQSDLPSLEESSESTTESIDLTDPANQDLIKTQLAGS